MAPLSEWLELMLAEIARRQEEAQLNAEEEARRAREASAAPRTPDATPDASNAAHAIEAGERRRRRG
jgi:hypothetical protein